MFDCASLLFRESFKNQASLLSAVLAYTNKLCTDSTVWSDQVIRPVLVRSDKVTTRMSTNEKQENTELTNN